MSAETQVEEKGKEDGSEELVPQGELVLVSTIGEPTEGPSPSA